MSKIEITSSNLDKFVKRFHKVSDAKENGKKLSESQEIFAQSLGCQNYNELKKILEKESVKELIKLPLNHPNDLYKGFVIENAENMSVRDISKALKEKLDKNISGENLIELFYNELLTNIYHPKSKIAYCAFEKDKFEYTIKFKSYYGDVYTYTFGKENIVTSTEKIGFSTLDVTLICESFTIANLMTTRFNSIDFANDFYKFLVEKRGDKKLFVLKFNEHDPINKNFVFTNDSLYELCFAYLNNDAFETIINKIDTNKLKGFHILNVPYYMLNDNRGDNQLIYYRNVMASSDLVIKIEDSPVKI